MDCLWPATERRIAALAIAGSVLVQCASPSPPPAATPPPSVFTPTTPPPDVIQPVTTAYLGASWHPGCPLDPQHLRSVDVDYYGFDTRTHRGALVVNEDVVADVIAIFEQLLKLRYPIAKIRPVQNYPGADDDLFMEDNNTSAFNCRDIPGTGHWSQHAFGRAVDLNPLLNPEMDATGAVQPQERRAISRPQPHRSRTLARERPRGARLHRSWLALGRLLAHAHRLSAL
jgi:hypothetical protein